MPSNARRAAPTGLTTVRDYIRWGASEFARARLVYGHGTDNALDEAFHLVLGALELPFDLPAVYLEATLTPAERRRLAALFAARLNTRKPVPYLLGRAWFCGLAFEVDARVLIPRSPIGELVQKHFQPWLTREPTSVLDLCAGSGCIGIACAYAFEDAQVDLAEIDRGALAVIAKNLARHSLGERVQARAGDLFGAIGDRRYDLIVSNPPYVPDAEWRALAPEFRHEPKRALAAGADGMDLVERILRESPDHLSDDGLLVCEIGGSQAEFAARYPDIPVTWPAFERGGDGVFVIGREELLAWLASRPSARLAAERPRRRRR